VSLCGPQALKSCSLPAHDPPVRGRQPRERFGRMDSWRPEQAARSGWHNTFPLTERTAERRMLDIRGDAALPRDTCLLLEGIYYFLYQREGSAYRDSLLTLLE